MRKQSPCTAQPSGASRPTIGSIATNHREHRDQPPFAIIVILLLLANITTVLAIQPFGANYTLVNSTTATPDTAASIPAIAGNVTEINIVGFSTTQSWQGYFGNISGTIQLADAGDNIMYNWSLASPQGEIYTSTSNSITWSNVQCFNYSALGTYADDTSNAGATSQYGTNLTQLEALFGIDSADVDGIDETFNLLGAGTHNIFYTNHLEFSEGECRSTRLFSNIGAGEDDKFEEVLLYEPVSQSVIFTSLIDEDVLGFDGRSHDFEMLVTEDGHGTDTSTTPYYFYVELE